MSGFFFSPYPRTFQWLRMCHCANWQSDKWSALNIHMETDGPLEKGPHPKTAGPMAGTQNSALKHLLSTLAIFKGREQESEKEESRSKYTGEDRKLACSLNGHFHRRSRDLGFFLLLLSESVIAFYILDFKWRSFLVGNRVNLSTRGYACLSNEPVQSLKDTL